jgi:uncharacterized protein YyaL (SSP411 family)
VLSRAGRAAAVALDPAVAPGRLARVRDLVRVPARAIVALAVCTASAVATLSAAPAASAAPTTFGDRGAYLAAAEDGVARIRQEWWNPKLGWYDTYRSSPSIVPLASAWDVYPLFEAVAAIALADPTDANRAAVSEFGIGAERYWNPDLQPLGGYGWYPDPQVTGQFAYFDDTGWLGIAFFDAYRATGDRRFLNDAIRAFRFIDIAGWAEDAGGGIWWNTGHEYKTAEPLAAGALLGAEIYQRTHVKWYLREAKKLIAWADTHSWNSERRLYARSDVSDTVMNYVQGMMIGAHVTLCRATRNRTWCRRAEQLAEASAAAFPPEYHWAPETDVIYLRWLLDLYENVDDSRWYAVVDAKAQQALAHARDENGLFTKRWDGGYASQGRLLTVAATVSLFAWVAAVPPPSQ